MFSILTVSLEPSLVRESFAFPNKHHETHDLIVRQRRSFYYFILFNGTSYKLALAITGYTSASRGIILNNRLFQIHIPLYLFLDNPLTFHLSNPVVKYKLHFSIFYVIPLLKICFFYRKIILQCY